MKKRKIIKYGNVKKTNFLDKCKSFNVKAVVVQLQKLYQFCIAELMVIKSPLQIYDPEAHPIFL